MQKQFMLILKLKLLNIASKGADLATTNADKRLFEEVIENVWGELDRYIRWSPKADVYVFKYWMHPLHRRKRQK